MALRKLQAEIDRTIKLITQGNDLFDETFEKLDHATNVTQVSGFDVVRQDDLPPSSHTSWATC